MAGMSRRSLFTLGLLGCSSLAPAASGAAHRSEAGGRRQRASSSNPVLGHGGVHHVAIRTRDWDRTLNFYRQALGFRMQMAWKEGSGTVEEKIVANGRNEENDRWAYLDSGDGTCVEVFEDVTYVPPAAGDDYSPTKNAGTALVHFGLRTSRIDAVCANAREHGALSVAQPADFTLHTTTGQGPVVVRIAFIQGPSGEWIELLQNAPRPAAD